MAGTEQANASGRVEAAAHTATGVRLALVGRTIGRRERAEAEPAAAREQRVLTTVLFTDVVDSTGHARTLGDARWLALLDRHEAMVRGAVHAAGGRITTAAGDGLVATFAGAGAAVRCAVAIAERSRALGLEVRCGLHCGETERRGARVGGIVFHVAARVVALAAPGEVLVSETLTQLAAGSALRFAKRGRRTLRGFPGAWTLYGATVTPDAP
jgi:class 3 adenylate cyclase